MDMIRYRHEKIALKIIPISSYSNLMAHEVNRSPIKINKYRPWIKTRKTSIILALLNDSLRISVIS
jgi:hypothetical protein